MESTNRRNENPMTTQIVAAITAANLNLSTIAIRFSPASKSTSPGLHRRAAWHAYPVGAAAKEAEMVGDTTVSKSILAACKNAGLDAHIYMGRVSIPA
jgi:hypothetical protein